MRISSISDLHIKQVNDAGYMRALAFLDSTSVANSDKIVFLGDIFDLMVANKKQYIKKFSILFKKLKVLCDSGKEVYFFEGNHDFNLERILVRYFSSKNFFYCKERRIIEDEGKLIYMSHGDEIDTEDLAYIKWKKLCSSFWFRFMLNFIFPYAFISWLGDWMSSKSRENGRKKFDYEKVKLRVEKMCLAFCEKEKVDFLICGHNHIKSLFENYANNGFPNISNCYVEYSSGKLLLKALPSVD